MIVLALNQAQIMRQQLEDEACHTAETQPKLPDKFKAAANWKIFTEVLDTYLGQVMSSGWVPLKYVIRTRALADPNTVYETPQAQMIALAPLLGDSFNRDNIRVYGIIKQLALEGPGRTYIMHFDATSDSRAAWFTLKNHFEGEGLRNQR
jgi:hypothetical protein